MRGINQVHYVGSLTQNPELRYTPGGMAILELTVAGRSEVIISAGEVKSLPFYNRCKRFGKYAESLAEGLQQGDVVSVHGRLDYRAWEQDDGEKRRAVETVITTIQSLEGSFVTKDDGRGQPVLEGGFNSVTIGGNLTKDAELKHLATGSSITRLSVAVNERYSGKNGDEEKVGFFELQAWGELAEVLAEGSKGAGLIGVGRLLNESWEDKDGVKRYGTKVELGRAHYVASGKPKPVAQAVAGGQRKAPLNIEEEFPPEEDLPF